MKKLILLCTFLILIFAGMQVTMAQEPETCLPIVEQALTAMEQACSGTGRNEICYGNINLLPNFTNPNQPLTFAAPGDVVGVQDLSSVILSPMVPGTEIWGVALARLQANLPDTLPGQNVTMILFGNVQVDGLNTASTTGFQFQSGVGRAQCTQAPENGVLLSTPEGNLTVKITVNGVEILLASTAFLQAEPGNEFSISMLEGNASVTAMGQTQSIGFGQKVSVPMDTNLAPAGPPGQVEAFDADKVFSILPIVTAEQTLPQEGDSTQPTQPIVQPPPSVPLASATPNQPCSIVAAESDEFGVHVGPGENRTRIVWLAAGEYDVTGKNGDWWQLIKEEAAPTRANAINEAWVQDDPNLEKRGNCADVRDVAAPELVPFTTATQPGPITATPRPGETIVPAVDPVVSIHADHTFLPEHQDCTVIHVRIEFASRAVLWIPWTGVFEEIPFSGTTAVYDRQICPSPGRHNMVLQVYRLNGSRIDYNYVIEKAGMPLPSPTGNCCTHG